MNTPFISVAFAATASVLCAAWTPAVHAQSIVSEGNAAGSQCAGVGVNKNGVVVGSCISESNGIVGFVHTNAPGTQEVVLPALAGLFNCRPTVINDAIPPKILGVCENTSSVLQGVVWQGTTGTAPVTLQPLAGLLGLAPDKKSAPRAVNLQGTIVGQSLNSRSVATPVVWNASGVATALTAPLLVPGGEGSVMSCDVVAISDNAAQSIVGQCNSPANGAPTVVLWPSQNAAYVVLPMAPNAVACTPVGINLAGQVAGTCKYANGLGRAVRWAAGGTTVPVVMANINGGATSHSVGIAMNDSGKIVGAYRTSRHIDAPFTWDPDAGVNGIGVTNVLGGSANVGVGIGTNATVIYTTETNRGYDHAAFGALGSTTETDAGTVPSGLYSQFVSLSRNGCHATGFAEQATGDSAAIYEKLTGAGC